MKTTFITWYPTCRRSDALAHALGGVSHLIHYLACKQPLYAPFKYVLQSLATWRQLWRDRPELILGMVIKLRAHRFRLGPPIAGNLVTMWDSYKILIP